jgi:hypothetical protein
MGDGSAQFERQRLRISGTFVRSVVLSGSLVFGWLILGGLQAEAQHAAQVRAREATGLLGAEEERTIVDVALEQVAQLEDARDCSHTLHAIYANAGYAYPYASSSEIYAGDKNFARVMHPRAGDVIAWRGHVGIVVDAPQHSFYSLVRTGLKAQDYESTYWKSRGVPRFYRLRIGSGTVLSAAKCSMSPNIKNQAAEK